MLSRVLGFQQHLSNAGSSHGPNVNLVGVFVSGFPAVIDDRGGKEVKLDVRMRNSGFGPYETARF